MWRMSLLVLTLGMGCDLVGQECNLMYAPDTLILVLENAPLSTTGATFFQVEGGGEIITCSLESPEETSGSCEGTGDRYLERDGDTVTLTLWEFVPEKATVTVFHDDAEVGSWSVTPSYDVDEPNGEGCGERSFAEESLDLAAE